MDFLLDLLQGVGLAAAIGIRPFLLAVLVLVVALDFAGRRAGRDAADRPPLVYGLLALALVLGALLAAGSVADRSSEWWAGAIAGLPAAALGFQAARQLFGRVRRRL